MIPCCASAGCSSRRQRRDWVAAQLEHARVVGEPRELAVEEPLVGRGGRLGDRLRHPRVPFSRIATAPLESIGQAYGRTGETKRGNKRGKWGFPRWPPPRPKGRRAFARRACGRP